MSYLKYIKGYSSCYSTWKYLRENTKTKQIRTLKTKVYNLPNSDDLDGLKEKTIPWYKSMDRDRKEFNTDKPKFKNKKSLRYLHFVLSPDPKDNVSLEQLEQFVDEWLDRAWSTERFGGKYSFAVEFHNDNGIMHAHIIMNNVNWIKEEGETNRFTSSLHPNTFHYAWQLRNQMCEDRGWHSFLDKQMKDIEIAKALKEGKEPENNISSETEKTFIEDKEFFEKNPKYSRFKNYRTPVERLVGNKQILTKKGAYYTKAEVEQIRREGTSIKEEIRKCIEIGFDIADTENDFMKILQGFGLEVELTSAGDYKYRHPQLSNVMFSGYKLGSNYTRSNIKKHYKELDPNHNYELANRRLQDILEYTSGDEAIRQALGISENQLPYKTQTYNQLENIGVSFIGKNPSIKIQDIAKASRINDKYNIWNLADYDKLIQNTNNKEILKELNFAKKITSKVNNIKPLRSNYSKPKKEVKNNNTIQDIEKAKGWAVKDMSMSELKDKLNQYYKSKGYDKFKRKKIQKGTIIQQNTQKRENQTQNSIQKSQNRSQDR